MSQASLENRLDSSLLFLGFGQKFSMLCTFSPERALHLKRRKGIKASRAKRWENDEDSWQERRWGKSKADCFSLSIYYMRLDLDYMRDSTNRSWYRRQQVASSRFRWFVLTFCVQSTRQFYHWSIGILLLSVCSTLDPATKRAA